MFCQFFKCGEYPYLLFYEAIVICSLSKAG
uniref:Uncharacterized protein n=1 Tax=Anguilla anguilla TaxID=7936 RepID=A0A0E9QGJ9_ANGAN